MTEKQAIYYGQVEIIPGIKCDGYVLNNNMACLSERGTADLLGMKQASLQSMTVSGVPKTLKPFISNDFFMTVTLVEVTAKNSPYKGRNIVVYSSDTIEAIMRAYAMAEGNNALQKNQMHVGRHCVVLLCTLARTALEATIKQACGLSSNLQQVAQKHYTDIVELMKQSGLKCSVSEEIAIKADITAFLVNQKTIRAIGSKASRLNGYHVQDVGTIALGMDSVVGISLKEKMFGRVSSLAKLKTKGEIEWQQILAEIFAGFSVYHNYQIGHYRVDFYVKELDLILEYNGYDGHARYNPANEMKREQFLNNYRVVRFHHQVDLKTLFNSILRAKIGTVTKLYHNLEMSNHSLEVGKMAT